MPSATSVAGPVVPLQILYQLCQKNYMYTCTACFANPNQSTAKEMLLKANLYDIDHIFKGSYSSCVG